MKKPLKERCKKLIIDEHDTVYAATGNLLSTVQYLFKFLYYGEKVLRPEDLAKIEVSLEQIKNIYEITDAEIEVETNYILDAAEFSGRKKK